ncbi:hypothetical protein Q7P37_009196 [Cladosporium fusiforme]
MGSIDRFAWTEVQPGRWERDVDEIEEFYLTLDRQFSGTGRHFFAIMGYISISMSVQPGQRLDECERSLEDALRQAWTRLRFNHPTLASWVEYNGKQPRKIYETGGTTEQKNSNLETWLENTFRPVFTDKTGLEWCNSDPPVPKLPTLFVLKTSESLVDGVARQIVRRDLVLRAPHDIIDGIGTLLLFNNLLSHTSAALTQTTPYQLPTLGSEITNLSPSFRIAAKLPTAITPDQLARIEDITASNAALRKDLPILSIPFNTTASKPGKHQRVSTTLTAQKTTATLTACRALSLSITQAYHTAIAMAVRDVQPPSSFSSQPCTKRYINYCLINERAQCTPPYNTPSHAAAVYHSTSGSHLGLDLDLPGTRSAASDKSDFARLAPQVKAYYLSLRNDASHPPLVPHYFAMATPKYPGLKDWKSASPPPIPSPNPTPSVSISSMGRLDELIAAQHGPLSVQDPWVTGEELGSGLGAFLGTFRGELRLSAAFNEAFHDRDEVLGFLGRVQEIVECGLGV